MNICNSGSGLKMAIERLCIISLCYVKSHPTYIFPIYHSIVSWKTLHSVLKTYWLKVHLSLQLTSNILLRLLLMFAQFRHFNISLKRPRLILRRDHNFVPVPLHGSSPELSLLPHFWHTQWELNEKLILTVSKAPEWLQPVFLYCSARAHPNEACTIAKDCINYALRKLPNHLGVSTHSF